MKVADYIIQRLVDAGITQCFMVTGGAALWLNDAIAGSGMDVVCMHHEQACAMAAEGYYKICGKPALVCVTGGPGVLNALAGVWGAAKDNCGMFVLSGQSRSDTLGRGIGDQECCTRILAQAAGVYAIESSDPEFAVFHMNELLKRCVDAPVWLSVPIDNQGKEIWHQYDAPLGDKGRVPVCNHEYYPTTEMPIAETAQALREANRPVIIVGEGVQVSKDVLLSLAEKIGVPLVGAFNGVQFVPNAHPCYAGRQGTIGDVPGNQTVQNADLVIIIGAKMPIRQTGYNIAGFAPNAKKIYVNLYNTDSHDWSNLTSYYRWSNLTSYKFDPCLFIDILSQSEYIEGIDHSAWCNERHEAAINHVQEYLGDGPTCVNPYKFIKDLFNALPEDAVVVGSNGSACVIPMQVGTIKSNTRFICNEGSASMGWGLPAAIGACIANGRKPVVCLEGDGSIMMNIQELATIRMHDLPICVVIIDNGGYSSIKQTQDKYAKNKVGYDLGTGLWIPGIADVARSFAISASSQIGEFAAASIASHYKQMEEPCVVNVVVDHKQEFTPKLVAKIQPDGTFASPSLSDME